MANPLLEPVSQFLNSPAKKRNLSIAIVLLLSLLGFGSLIYWNSMPDYQVLFSNLAEEDAADMVAKLKEKKIPFRLSSNGSSILVPKDQVYDVRLSLAAEGLPKGGGIGFEVFDRTNLGATDFVQRMNYQRALQGELARTIRQIQEVEQARVHIVMPKESLFVEDQKKPTASIFIKTRGAMSLSPPQVEGIVHLVASAVEGLEPGNITVVDTSGKILFQRADSSLEGQMTTHQLEYQRNIEERLKKKVQGMLEGVLGLNKAIARVSADIDFQQIDITEERYDPNTVIRSEQKNLEKSSMLSAPKGTGQKKPESAQGSRTPKAKAPFPGSPKRDVSDASLPVQTNSTERQNEIRNYEVTKINKRIKNPVGTLKRISVAVIVDGNYKEGKDAKGKKEKEFIPRTPEEMKNIESIVKRAIGYEQERGDQVEVINMPFSWSVMEEESQPLPVNPWKEYFLISYKPVVSLLLALFFILFVVRPLLKRRPLASEDQVAYLPKISQPALPPQQEAPREEKPLSLRQQSVHLVQEEPSKALGIVRDWINER
jgi:flagellar M-ring protein FliF